MKVIKTIVESLVGLAVIGLLGFFIDKHHVARDLKNYITSHKPFVYKGKERFCQFTERQARINNLKKELREIEEMKKWKK